MAVLGNTLTLIAGEKAGIIKPGVPVVSSPQVEEAHLVLEKIAAERGSPLTLIGRDVAFKAGEHSLEKQSLQVWTNGGTPVKLTLPLLGEHQMVNAATAYAALKASGLIISDEDIRVGFDRVQWPCRFEIVRKEPPIIFDSAHNKDSFEKLAQTLEEYFPGQTAILIFGSSEDKDMDAMLGALKGQLSIVLATQAVHPRALVPEKIVETANRLGIRAEVAVPVHVALARALDLATGSGEIVLSAGSMFVVAEAKTAWEKMDKG
jgi:dihydrofolate synthase/folylpolyglutamate synthase